jgi:hypothetical protein
MPRSNEELGMQSFEKGHKFEDKVVALLRLMGMDVKPRENYGCRETDFVATEKTRFSEQWYVGECKDYGHKVGVEEVGLLFARVTSFENDHHQHNVMGLLVVAGEDGIGDRARGHARSYPATTSASSATSRKRAANMRRTPLSSPTTSPCASNPTKPISRFSRSTSTSKRLSAPLVTAR